MRWQLGDTGPKWKKWFAWYPVRIKGSQTVVWLEHVERFDYSCDIGGYTDFREIPMVFDGMA